MFKHEAIQLKTLLGHERAFDVGAQPELVLEGQVYCMQCLEKLG
jgi:hypothetical protein